MRLFRVERTAKDATPAWLFDRVVDVGRRGLAVALGLAAGMMVFADTPKAAGSTARCNPAIDPGVEASLQGLVAAGDRRNFQEIGAWEARFRARIDIEHADNLKLARSGDSFLHYQLAYPLDGFTAMYEATGKAAYLDYALRYTTEVIDSAVASSAIANSQYRDSFMGWEADRHPNPKIDGKEYPLFESYFWRYAARMLRVMKTSGLVEQDLAYRAAYDEILAFLEVQVFDKWLTRGEDNIYRSRTHMAAHWAFIALQLSLLTEDERRRTQAEAIFERINGSLRANMKPHPDVVGGYFWHATWNQTDPPGQDVPHGNGVIAYLVEAAELREGWSLSDMRALSSTFEDAIWRQGGGRSSYAQFVDGSGKGRGWFNDGFIKLARFSPGLQERLADHTVGRNTQLFGNAALNARRLGLACR